MQTQHTQAKLVNVITFPLALSKLMGVASSWIPTKHS